MYENHGQIRLHISNSIDMKFFMVKDYQIIKRYGRGCCAGRNSAGMLILEIVMIIESTN